VLVFPTGLALWWAISNLEWEHVSIVVAGWAVSWVIGLVIDEFYSSSIGFAITGALGGLATALALWRAIPNFEWKQVFAVTAGWGVGWVIGLLISLAALVPLTVYLLPSEVTTSSRLIALAIQLIALAIGGAVSGAIGGLATELTLWWVSMLESTSNT